jgi:hypothetical protein
MYFAGVRIFSSKLRFFAEFLYMYISLVSPGGNTIEMGTGRVGGGGGQPPSDFASN